MGTLVRIGWFGGIYLIWDGDGMGTGYLLLASYMLFASVGVSSIVQVPLHHHVDIEESSDLARLL